MKAMILAAGKGKRLLPLTTKTPKALIEVGGKKLIEYHLEHLQRLGINEIAINTGHLAEKVHQHLGDGSVYGVDIRYSDEGEHLLNTGGGIRKMLPWMNGETFVVINADVFSDYQIHDMDLEDGSAHLVVVDNPDYHSQGDFYWDGKQIQLEPHPSQESVTFAGIAYYTPHFFDAVEARPIPLVEILHQGIKSCAVSAEKHTGLWEDVGTLERLESLQQKLSGS